MKSWILLAIMALWFLGCGKPFVRPTQSQEKEALRLIGRLGGGQSQVSCSPKEFVASGRLMDSLHELAEKEDFAEQVHSVQINSDCDKAQLLASTEDRPNFKKLQAILGKPMGTETGKVNIGRFIIEVTWYKYGLINLAVSDEQVVELLLAFKGDPEFPSVRR